MSSHLRGCDGGRSCVCDIARAAQARNPSAPRALADAEMVGLAALVAAQTADHTARCARLVMVGLPPDGFSSWAADRIEAELKRRGISP